MPAVLNQSLEIACSQEDEYTEKLVLSNLSDIHLQMGDDREAVRYHRQALNLAQKVNDRATQDSALSNLGIGLLRLQQYNSTADQTLETKTR